MTLTLYHRLKQVVTMGKSPSAQVDSGLAQITAGIVVAIIGFGFLTDAFWHSVFVVAGFIIIIMGVGNLRRTRRQVIAEHFKEKTN